MALFGEEILSVKKKKKKVELQKAFQNVVVKSQGNIFPLFYISSFCFLYLLLR